MKEAMVSKLCIRTNNVKTRYGKVTYVLFLNAKGMKDMSLTAIVWYVIISLAVFKLCRNVD